MKKEKAASEKGKLLLRTYLMSLLSLMLCVTMLLGTTFAWFTSEVKTGGNEIYVGTLKVDLTDKSGVSLENQTGLFGSGTVRWEPGATQIETVQVVNKGDLAFDYGLYLSAVGTEEPKNLVSIGKYIDVYITSDDATATNAEELKNNWIRVGTLAEVATNGYMLANGSWTPTVTKTGGDVVDVVSIALHMPADVSDTSIMGQKITNLGIKLIATQKVAETDDFGDGYDEAAPVDVLVASYDELAAAVNAGQSMRLTADITVPDNMTLTVASGKNVVIDMNGHDITATSSGTNANRELFLVKGNLIVKGVKDETATAAEGETVEPYKSVITYSHKAEDEMNWNHMSTIFDITAGGSVQLIDVKAVNAGGTAMNFVAHLNNWGEASLVMDGAYLEAPYCAIRVFNSGYDMNNVSAKDSTISANSRALWVHMYTAEDFGANYDAEAVDARLNIDILSDTNHIDGKICYGFTNGEVTYVANDADDLTAAVKNSGTVLLREDITLTQELAIEGTNTVTIDLDGNTLTNTDDRAIRIDGDANVTIKNGTVQASSYIMGLFGNGKVAAEKVKFQGANGFGTNGSLTNADAVATFTDCEFTVSSGYNAAYISAQGVYTFKNCVLEGGAGVLIRSGNVTLDGCTIIANGYMGKGVDQPDFYVNGSVTDGQKNGVAYWAGSDQEGSTGDCVVIVDRSGNGYKLEAVTITGCTFKFNDTVSGKSYAVRYFDKAASSEPTVIPVLEENVDADGKAIVTDYTKGGTYSFYTPATTE